jgi:hypothetical protein
MRQLPALWGWRQGRSVPVLGYSDQPFVRRARGTLNFGEIPILLRPGTAAVRTNGPSQKLYLRFLFGQGLSQ